MVNVVIRCSSCKVQESDTYDVLNICHGLDGKEEMEAIQGVLVIIFSTFRKEMADERRTMVLQILEASGL